MFSMVVLVAMSVAMAVLLYAGQIAYMVVFALFGVIIAGYAWLMARLLGRRLSGWTFQLVWALALAVSLLGEGWARTHGGLAGKGVLPAAVAVFQQWKDRDQIALPATAQAKPVDLPPSHDSIIDDASVRKDLTALVVAELCNNADLAMVRTKITQVQVSLPPTLRDSFDLREYQSTLLHVQQAQPILIDIVSDQLQNYRVALDKGKGILSALKGANASLVMGEFTEDQGKLIANDENWNATIVPIYQKTTEAMALALKVKSQNTVSRETGRRWSELLPQIIGSQKLNDLAKAQAKNETDARNALGKLVGETLPYDPHYQRVFGHCTRSLPNALQNDQWSVYLNQIMARWDSDTWLTQGRDQQAYRQQ